MFLIVIYDVNAANCPKVNAYLKRHLQWVQNSAFEGQVTSAQFAKIRSDLKKMLGEKEKVTFYLAESKNAVEKAEIGPNSLTSWVV